MARLVVYSSDEEFPDVNEVIRGKAGRKTSQKVSGETNRKVERSEPKSDLKKEKGSTVSNVKELGSDEIESSENAKPKARKRVLKQNSDNPLLKPLSMGTKRSSTEPRKISASNSAVPMTRVMKEEPRRKATVVKPRIPDFEEERKVVARNYRVTDSEEEKDEDDSDDLPGFLPMSKVLKDEPKRKPISLKPRISDLDEKRRPTARKPTKTESEDEDEEEEDDDLSDFIVDDDDDSDVFKTPPKSTRRLVRGRRTVVEESSDTDTEEELLRQLLDKTTLDDKDAPSAFNPPVLQPPNRDEKVEVRPGTSSSFDDNGAVLRFSPSSRKVSKGVKLSTPPGSPELKPRGLASPKKLSRIPSTPHRPSMDSFWSQDLVNDWNDQYSPMKTLQPISKPKLQPPSTSRGTSLFKKPPSFKAPRIDKESKKAFSISKHTIASDFLLELDTKITSGRIAELSASTGGVQIIWSKKLITTAGRANWKRETIKSPLTTNTDGKAPTTFRHYASIELAEKVIDDENRLLNVLAHEFCHLANFMISNIKTNPHGKEFKEWAAKCSNEFGDRGIEVTTKHSYEIEYKYVWECTEAGCKTLFKRHSKSIDTQRHRCGACKGVLAQIKPVPRGAAKNGKENEYQVFVKENMKRIRDENPGSPQKDIMGLVAKKYQEQKASKAAQVGGRRIHLMMGMWRLLRGNSISWI
ncbi:putative hmg box-containing protein [Botrytis fragariae]|uniref:Putative hmg box-containing protein n=1 Tax=Botrytis fragariae TaxID=1964551 RepID=A0A8H6ELC9_9HELO|nr:putative hmg box-containing protein [Botrytis fragariae]KAF5876468.1 putative hmg box-containing protein [Botrytis fragariae]